MLTEEQLKSVLADVQKQVGNADEKNDTKALDSRAAGAFKYLRGKRYDMLKDEFKVDKPLTLNTQVLRSVRRAKCQRGKVPPRDLRGDRQGQRRQYPAAGPDPGPKERTG
ncbi:hypothetical protein AAHB37_07050 [Glutamicibacter halophytocola]|uniref:hypothetical protein n=1 Tax=Glutamicibacter halophytocola TaxID=1933880 RepID=UPI00321A60AB